MTEEELKARCNFWFDDQVRLVNSLHPLTVTIIAVELSYDENGHEVISYDGHCKSDNAQVYDFNVSEYVTAYFTLKVNECDLEKIGKSCNHKWVTYNGFTSRFDYCEHCDLKRE